MARAGRFSDRVAFFRLATGARDRFGSPAPAGEDVLAEVWGDLREAPGREALAAGAEVGLVPATLRCRSSAMLADVRARDFVRARGYVWRLVSPGVLVSRSGAGVLEFRLERGEGIGP